MCHEITRQTGRSSLLAYGTRDPSDMCRYPDSGKILFGGLGVVARVEPLAFWDGEP